MPVRAAHQPQGEATPGVGERTSVLPAPNDDETMRNIPLHPKRSLVVAALSATILLVAAGCSTTLNSTTLQNQLAEQIAARVGVPAPSVTVTCPGEIAAAAGTETVCTAKVDGFTYEVTATQTNGEGAVEWQLGEPSEDAATSTTTAG